MAREPRAGQSALFDISRRESQVLILHQRRVQFHLADDNEPLLFWGDDIEGV